jgi:hypothetical protein
MEDKAPRSIASQLKRLGQQLGIRNQSLRHVVDSGVIPGISTTSLGLQGPHEMEEETLLMIALAAILYDHGFEGSAIFKTALHKAKSQLHTAKGSINIDCRGDFPIQIRISTDLLMKRLRDKK